MTATQAPEFIVMVVEEVEVQTKVRTEVRTEAQLKPTRILYSYPATIVWWNDGTKTVVKCKDGWARDADGRVIKDDNGKPVWEGDPDQFTTDAGFAAALVKKMYGNASCGNYRRTVLAVSDFSLIEPPVPEPKPLALEDGEE